ncbi:MAG: hypothetical protein JNK78_02480 [Planctomycetes bacterium]|nr:hypothetical protein [Planctomycetota bacterium]
MSRPCESNDLLVLGVACIAGANFVARQFGSGALVTPWSAVDVVAGIVLVSLPALVVRRSMFPPAPPPPGRGAFVLHHAARACGAAFFVVGWWIVAALSLVCTAVAGLPLVVCLLERGFPDVLGVLTAAMAAALVAVLAVGSRRAWSRSIRRLVRVLAWPTALLTTGMVGLGTWWNHVEGGAATHSVEIGRQTHGWSDFVALRRDADYPNPASWVRVEQRVPIVPNLIEWRRTCLAPRAGHEVVFAVVGGAVRVTFDPGTSCARTVFIGD